MPQPTRLSKEAPARSRADSGHRRSPLPVGVHRPSVVDPGRRGDARRSGARSARGRRDQAGASSAERHGWCRPRRARLPRPARPVSIYTAAVQELIDELGRLPGIGRSRRSASRSISSKVDKPDALRLARAIADVKERVRFCSRCFNVSEHELCSFCEDPQRDSTIVCVVEEPPDIVAVERTQVYRAVSRAPGVHQPHRRHRSRAVTGGKSCSTGSNRRAGRGHHLHQPEPRR